MEYIQERPEFIQGENIPDDCEIAGWTALIHGFSISAPLRDFCCVSRMHVYNSKKKMDKWTIYDKRYAPDNSPLGQLEFAIKHQKIDLLILKRALLQIPKAEIEQFIKLTPTGIISRKIWFFYEKLIGEKLNIKDLGKVKFINALDEKQYFTAHPKPSRRHKINDNMLGDQNFCPIIRKTKKLENFIAMELTKKADAIIGKTSSRLISRAASFMLLADSRASYEIEGERPPKDKIERWGKVILQAGKRSLSEQEINRIHEVLLGQDSITKVGYRNDGVFLGERDYNNDPLPDFIGARPIDINRLMTGLFDFYDNKGIKELDPVVVAAILSFGFVFIHPLEDGNGRLQRYLIHHALAEFNFSPKNMIFPVSSVMLDRIDDFQNVLENHSAPLMDHINWEITEKKNVEVINETFDLYAYFDATEIAEFLYECVLTTIDHDLPREISYLKAHDEALKDIMDFVEMPDQMAKSMINCAMQNDGRIAKKRREKEFQDVSSEKLDEIEKIINTAFEEHRNLKL